MTAVGRNEPRHGRLIPPHPLAGGLDGSLPACAAFHAEYLHQPYSASSGGRMASTMSSVRRGIASGLLVRIDVHAAHSIGNVTKMPAQETTHDIAASFSLVLSQDSPAWRRSTGSRTR